MFSRFQKRRIYYVLGLTYDSGADGMEKAVKTIRKILDDHPEVLNDHYVFFTDFGDSSLNIMCYFFAKTTVWREYLRIRQEVNITIMRELEKIGLQIAFPTTTINFDEDALSAFKHMNGMGPIAPTPSAN
jgi:MscS family membrane protein